MKRTPEATPVEWFSAAVLTEAGANQTILKAFRRSSRWALFPLLASIAVADTPSFTVLHHFDVYTEGGNPSVPEALTLSEDTLYGVTFSGGLGIDGAGGEGTLFSVKTNGDSFAVVHAFPSLTEHRNVDGAAPVCTLKFVGGKLYGTATKGGTLANGVLYSVNPDGTDFAPLFNFSGSPWDSSGARYSPFGGLVLEGEVLYGVTAFGGNPWGYDGSVNGRIYAASLAGSVTVLYAFPEVLWDGGHYYTPYGPSGGVVLVDGKLYGMTWGGGYENYGTIFSVNSDGSGYTTLHYFTNIDGATPRGSLVLSGGAFYGVTQYGGNNDQGVIFTIKPDGSDFAVLHRFEESGGSQATLLASGDMLYGSTPIGGSRGDGTVFSIRTNGGDYTVLHVFDRFADGSHPGGLIAAGNVLYGMAASGGRHGHGTIFSLSSGLSQPTLAAFRSTYRLAADGSEDLLAPAGDGVANLLKFSFNMLGTGPGQAELLSIPNHHGVGFTGSAGLPSVGVDPEAQATLTYVRLKASGAAGITYRLESSSTLFNGSWDASEAVESSVEVDANFERVTVALGVPDVARGFYRVHVSVTP